VQRNAAQRVQQCVSQRDRWCAVAGHSRRHPAWCTLHCHSSGSSGGESGARLQCCALLPQPSAPHSSQMFAGGGVSPRRRGSASARSCCLDHVPARQQVALCRRCRRPARRARLASRARQALGSHGKDATSAIDSPEPPTVRRGRGRGPRHPSMQWQGSSDRPSVAKVAVRRGVRWKRERCCFCCAID